MSVTLNITADSSKPGKFIVAAMNGTGEFHRDTLNPNSDASRERFGRKVVAKAFKEPPAADVLASLRASIEEQLLAAARTPPGEASVTAVTEQPGEEPWTEPVDGPALLDDLCGFLKSYMILPEWTAETLALWLVHTYLPDCCTYTPYIWVSSPVRECGKSTLLELLSHLSYRGQMTGGITAAALYRRIHRSSPTMILDELDTRLRGDSGEALRGVLNTGFSRTGKVTICVGDQHEDQDFNTYCPKVLAGIGRLWDTVVSRSIPVRLKRASKVELKGLKKIRGDHIAGQCRPYRRKLLRYACDVRERVTVTETVTPDSLSARQCDVWRPLLAIATVTGGHWTVTGPKAAVEIHKVTGEEGDHGLLLLEDLRTLFAGTKDKPEPDALFSADIVEELVKKEDRPWPEFRGDKPITKNGLASLLKRFDVRPQTVRVAGATAKGYKRADLVPLFGLYLPTPEQTVTTVTNPETRGSEDPGVTVVTVQPGVDGEDDYDRLEREAIAEHGGG